MKNKTKFLLLIFAVAIVIFTSCAAKEHSETNGSSSEAMLPTTEEYFVKAKVSYFNIYFLTNLGKLYEYDLATSKLNFCMDNIKDFYSDMVGKVTCFTTEGLTGIFNWEQTAGLDEYDNFFIEQPDIKSISNMTLLLNDGSIMCFDYFDGTWKTPDIKCLKADTDIYTKVQIIDEQQVLWQFDIENETLQKIAENVKDVSSSNSDKFYYSSDIWYVTTENELRVIESFSMQKSDDVEPLPDFAKSVVASHGYFLIEQDKGYLIGNIQGKISQTEIPGVGVYADLLDGSYVIVDTDGTVRCHITFDWNMEPGHPVDFTLSCPE